VTERPPSSALKPKRFLVVMTTIAAPVSLGFETLLRKLFFPLLMGDDFELVRDFLRPLLTPVAWMLCGVALLANFAGFALHAWLVARILKRLPEERRALREEREWAELPAFLVAASVPQMPCLFSTLMFTFGAELLPVLLGVGLGSLGVLVQALRTRSRSP
jgi:membrane protein YqaA with SNARE-associated domain